MAVHALVRVAVVMGLVFSGLRGSLGQDCTGVDCPELENCIEESLGSDSCCATCLQRGCSCQGYQYYDCINAGFRNGKVPEGESYFVDFGSTECSCPEGGGRISCHFIPCPDIPANCIERSVPSDGCIQCERVGCVHNEQKYEAGHSFHIDPCQVCHCPNDGGSLMCYPVPDCDTSKMEKPMLSAATEGSPHNKPLQFPFQHHGPWQASSKPYRLGHEDTLPMFAQPHPNLLDDDEEEEEGEMDYDYMPTDTPGPLLVDLAGPTESSILSSSYPDSVRSRVSIYRDERQELRETVGVHQVAAFQDGPTQGPSTVLQQTTPPEALAQPTTASWWTSLKNQVFRLSSSGDAGRVEDAGWGYNPGKTPEEWGHLENEEGEMLEEEEVEEESIEPNTHILPPQIGDFGPPFTDDRQRHTVNQGPPFTNNRQRNAQTRDHTPSFSDHRQDNRQTADHGPPFNDNRQKNTQTEGLLQTSVTVPQTDTTNHRHNITTATSPLTPQTDTVADRKQKKPLTDRRSQGEGGRSKIDIVTRDRQKDPQSQIKPVTPKTDQRQRVPLTHREPVTPKADSAIDHRQSDTLTHKRPVTPQTVRNSNHRHSLVSRTRPHTEPSDRKRVSLIDNRHADSESSRDNSRDFRRPLLGVVEDKGGHNRLLNGNDNQAKVSLTENGDIVATHIKPVDIDGESDRAPFADPGYNRNSQREHGSERVDHVGDSLTGIGQRGHSGAKQTLPTVGQIHPDAVTGLHTFGWDETTEGSRVRSEFDAQREKIHGDGQITESRRGFDKVDASRELPSDLDLEGNSPNNRAVSEREGQSRGHARATVIKTSIEERERNSELSIVAHGRGRDTAKGSIPSQPDLHRENIQRETATGKSSGLTVGTESERGLVDYGAGRTNVNLPAVGNPHDPLGSPPLGFGVTTQGGETRSEDSGGNSSAIEEDTDTGITVIRQRGVIREDTDRSPVFNGVHPGRVEGQHPEIPLVEHRPKGRQQDNNAPLVGDLAKHTTRPHTAHGSDLLPGAQFITTTTTEPPRSQDADGPEAARSLSEGSSRVHDGGEGERPKQRGRLEDLQNSLSSLPVDESGVFAVKQVESCCEMGKTWAANNHHCNDMPPTPDDGYVLCSVVQEQCCVGALRQSRCLAGMSAARGGSNCHASPTTTTTFGQQTCPEDSYQECCSCCSLGLQLREAGLGCEAHHHLDFPCGHVLLTCCEDHPHSDPESLGHGTHGRGRHTPHLPPTLWRKEEEPRLGGQRPHMPPTLWKAEGEMLQNGPARPAPPHSPVTQDGQGFVGEHGPDAHPVWRKEIEQIPGLHKPDVPTLRRKETVKPTATPMKVTDRKFSNEAFSRGAVEDSGANALLETSQSVDACQKYAAQLCHHICINTWGSYQCACRLGYVLMSDGHTCAPDDPEEANRLQEEHRPVAMPTSSPATFRPTPSSSSMRTTTSTTTTTKTAIRAPHHFNPCAGNGPCSQRCSVAAGRAKCSCLPGFSLKSDGHTCEDMDECLTNTHTCKPNEVCVNTLGAFVCEKKVSCSPGYKERNGVCEDIDECMTRTHNCGSSMQCRNLEGSFSCVPKQPQRCYTGFTQDSHGNCIDIDECQSLSEPCRSGFNCVNTVGSYTCQHKVISCGPGYQASPDGTRCTDVDECQTGIHRCGEGQVCQNIPGSYRCNCQTGYQYDATRQTCVDVNECWRYPGRLCSQTCENTPGSYVCSCTAGFAIAADGKNCEDVNECDGAPCSQECANIYGSYQCYCRQGYYLKEDGHTCEDIDECSQNIGHLCAFQCVNVPGSYQCACPPNGYTMSPNGRTCRDIDECATSSHNCSLSESCFNIQGSFRCLSFTCPPNYRKVSDIRCERVSCVDAQDCQSSPLRITYYQLSFQTNILIPAQIFRIGPSPAYAGDSIMIGITRGNQEGYFSTRRLNGFTGAVYLQRQVREPRDFLIDVEMKLLRQGTFTTFLARIYVFITASTA